MIRFIIKKTHGSCDYPKQEELKTLDLDVPELERALQCGGYSQYGFEMYNLVGVEILTPSEKREGEGK